MRVWEQGAVVIVTELCKAACQCIGVLPVCRQCNGLSRVCHQGNGLLNVCYQCNGLSAVCYEGYALLGDVSVSSPQSVATGS